MAKKYTPPKILKKGNTKLVIVATVHKGCSSSSAKSKKG